MGLFTLTVLITFHLVYLLRPRYHSLLRAFKNPGTALLKWPRYIISDGLGSCKVKMAHIPPHRIRKHHEPKRLELHHYHL
jgi:hypothetical protein